MKCAHEETWRVWNDHGGIDQVALEGTRDVILENVSNPNVGHQADARVRLASQAPAMARILLALRGPACATCDAFEATGTHHERCEITNTLRAAGVLDAD